MTFQIYSFIFIFVALTGFYLAAPKYRAGVLAALSAVFCGFQDVYALGVLIVVTAAAFGAGIVLGTVKPERVILRKAILTLSAAVFVGLFILWKFFSDPEDYFIFLMPLGFSYYGFQAISYLTDIYRGKISCEKNFIRFALYMAWFPKFISGPIERAGSLLPQTCALEEVRLFDGKRIIRGLSYILWGFFMKLMIADRAAPIVAAVFDEYEEYGSIMLIIGSLLYTMQIYCDFAGYTDVAIGVSCLFGLELTQNFKTPYFSENITEFWRRWHISLSSFLRDYIYIPLGGNRKGTLRKCLNIMIVFIVCGFWHGRGRRYIVWGLIHGVFSVITNVLKKGKTGFLFRGIPGTVITFSVVSFGWILFRAESWDAFWGYVSSMFTSPVVKTTLQNEFLMTGVSALQYIILLLSMALLIGADFYTKRHDTLIPEIIIKTGEIRRNICFITMAVLILVFGMYGDQEIRNFIYMKF